MRRAARIALALAALAGLAACGTTVPGATDTALSDGLTEQAAPGSDITTAIDGVTTPDGTTPVSGTGGSGSSGSVPTAGSAGGGSASSGSGSSGSSEGSGEDLGPIKVGVITADYAALVGAVGGGALPDTSRFARVLVDGLNARGGMAGRRIDAVYYSVDGSAADYSSQYQAACDAFTRDNRVEAVIAQDGIDLFWSCLLKAGVPVVVASNAVNTDSTHRRQFPNVFQPAGLAVDRLARALLTESVATGWLTRDNRVGVLTSGCEWGNRLYDDVVVPTASELGVEVERFALDCPTPGAAMLGEYSAAIQGAALQFRSNGVDRVMFATENDAAAYVFFTRNADSQQWYPGYIGGSVMGAPGWSAGGVTSVEQARNTRGLSWARFDLDPRPEKNAQNATCLDLVAAGGGEPPADEGTEGLWYGFCDAFLPLRDAVVRAGGAGGLAALQPAFEGLGTSYVSASNIDGVIELGPDRHEGTKNAVFFAYVAECSCFRGTTAPRPT